MSSLFGSNPVTSSSTVNTGTNSLVNISTIPELKDDRELVGPIDDSISDLAFSSQADFLAVSSWDNKVRIYEVAPNGDSQGKALYEHQGPVLSVHWSPDGSKVVSGGSDKAARLFDLQSGQATQIAAHDATVSGVRFVNAGPGNQPLIATASWDKTLKYWDSRQQTPISTVTLPERAYSIDSQQSLMVVATAERHICIFNLTNPGTIFKSSVSPLKWGTRVISCYPQGNGYAIGSIEGRCAIQYIDDRNVPKLDFSFKCHRSAPTTGSRPEVQVYSINSISFHPQYGTFSTAGSDGTFNFWDKDSRHRLKNYPPLGASISATAFNRNGTIYAYALSYDWSKGYQFNTPDYPHIVRLHPTKEEEVKPRAGTRKR